MAQTKFRYGEIPFTAIEDNGYNIVVMALSVPESDIDECVADMNSYFTDNGFFKPGTEIVGMQRITGNIKGKAGRTDWLVSLSTDLSGVSPIKRLLFGDWVKWTGDFLDIYAEDYSSDEA